MENEKLTQVEKMGDCEYELVDKTSDPCHNPPTFIDRKGGHVVCVAHADSLETFLQEKAHPEVFSRPWFMEEVREEDVTGGATEGTPIDVPGPKGHKHNHGKKGGIPMTITPGGIVPGVK